MEHKLVQFKEPREIFDFLSKALDIPHKITSSNRGDFALYRDSTIETEAESRHAREKELLLLY
jgi:hypothetical protein